MHKKRFWTKQRSEDSSSRNLYCFLEEVLPAHQIPKMLGRVVVGTAYPLKDFIPYSIIQSFMFNPQDIINDIMEDPVVHTNFAVVFELTGSYASIAKFSTLGPAVRKRMSKMMIIEAPEVIRYDLINIAQKLQILVKST